MCYLRYALLSMLAIAGASAGAEHQPLTVQDAIETTRLMTAVVDDGSLTPVFVSPSGRRYAIMLLRGDVQRDGVSMDIKSGGLSSIKDAVHLREVAHFFTRATGRELTYGEAPLHVYPGQNPLIWLDDERVAFFWEDSAGVRQVVEANVSTGKIRYLTEHPMDVLNFAVGRDGTIIYSARERYDDSRSKTLLERGFAVRNPDAFSLLAGHADGRGLYDDMYSSRKFIRLPHQRAQQILNTDGRGADRWILTMRPVFSPDGSMAIVDGTPSRMEEEWTKYTDANVSLAMSDWIEHSTLGYTARQIWQLFVIDIKRGTSRPLWNAPKGSGEAAWSPDGRSVVLTRSFVPVSRATPEALAGRSTVEVDVRTGDFVEIPVPPAVAAGGAAQVHWESNDVLQLLAGNSRIWFKKVGGRWEATTTWKPRTPEPASSAINVLVHEDLNSPPALFAVDRHSGREELVLDPNPKLRSQFALGRVEMVAWRDRENRVWRGRLYYPTRYVEGRRYPLVIQTHGYAPASEFSLYGKGPLAPGLGPGVSIYAAQPLANKGIAVLQLEDKFVAGIRDTPLEPEMYMFAYEAAVEHFVSTGLADPEKIGLAGYSRTAWHVQYALTHSRFTYAAAIAADGMDASYVQHILVPRRYEDFVGSSPVGDGLQSWFQRSPGFNAAAVHTPLRLQAESGPLASVLFNGWELFVQLRRLHRPVELYVVPDIAHGSHALQNPRQSRASLQGAVDWFDFWLNGREDSDIGKSEQYERWCKLRDEHEADLQGHGCSIAGAAHCSRLYTETQKR